MSFWGKLFGSDKALSGVVDGITNGIDKIWYTDEEKSEDAAKAKRDAAGFLINWMESTKGQNLARRFLAMMITFVWLVQYLIAKALLIAAVWVGDPKQLMESAAVISADAQSMTGAMMLILGFYFAAPHMGSIAKAALERFGGKK
jgi:hypothetical protein